ncbi:hypothetical protein DITRI_Ditri20bG0053100 [Diplodiscus trichospermus]
MRRINRRERRTLEAWQIAAAEIEVRNWRIMRDNDLLFLVNTLDDLWVYELLVQLENDLMRNAFERISARNLDGRNIINDNHAQPFQDDGAAGARRE